MKKYYIICLLTSFTISLQAQVRINEYSASNLNSFPDSFEKTEDWIELHNSSTAAVDIGGWHLSDKTTKPEKWEIPAGTMIPANGFLVFHCSGRDQFVNNEYHTNFKLTQTKAGEFVLLSDATGSIVESYEMQLTLVEASRCRMMDGADEWMICTDPTPNSSNNSASKYISYTATPTMDLTAGFYAGAQEVNITNNEPNSVLRYTTNGLNPTNASDEYSGPISVTSTTVIKAQAFSNDPEILTGKMDFNTYFIDEDYSLAVFSVAANEVIELANGDGARIPIGSLEYFNTDKAREATSFGSLNRHGQDSWVLPHRSLDWVSRDEMGYSKAVQAPLFSNFDRSEYQKFMFRNSGDDNYPAISGPDHRGSCHIRDEYVQTLAQEGGLELDIRSVERVILFLNGEYWGVYGMRDRPVDHDYTDEHYNQGKYDLQYLTTWGITEIQYGGQQALDDWSELRDFILNNDMSIPENYQRVDDEINLTSMIDYFIVNLTVVASDWLNYNTGWWRGLNPDGKHKKWGYILWDLDATFDYYINYSGVPDISPNAKPCDLLDIAEYMEFFFGSGYYGNGDVGQHEKILLRLLEQNETFQQLYYSRYADAMNTVYTCENMMTTLDRMLDVIRPEMPGQIARWGGSVNQWEENVTRLKTFIEARCTLLDDGMTDCYDELTGPYELTLMVEPDGIGEIDLNTLDIEAFPWTGNYFGGMENKIKAKVFNEFEDDYQFSHWVSTSGSIISPDANERKAAITITEGDTLTAVFSVISSSDDISSNTLAFNAFPNPATSYLTIEYHLEDAAKVQLSLYSILGEKIVDLNNSQINQSSGNHNFNINLADYKIAPGLYLLKLNANDNQASRKISILQN